jgi:hypothetical protein
VDRQVRPRNGYGDVSRKNTVGVYVAKYPFLFRFPPPEEYITVVTSLVYRRRSYLVSRMTCGRMALRLALR